MRLIFVNTPEEATVTLNQTKLAEIINSILSKFEGEAFTSLYIREDVYKPEIKNAYYAPFANVPKLHTEYVYEGDSTGLIISIP